MFQVFRATLSIDIIKVQGCGLTGGVVILLYPIPSCGLSIEYTTTINIYHHAVMNLCQLVKMLFTSYLYKDKGMVYLLLYFHRTTTVT